MEKSWSVKTNGKFSLLIFVFFASLFFYTLVILYMMNDGNTDEPFDKKFSTYFFSMFLFFIIWLISVFPIILKRKIPIRLKMNEEALIFSYSNRKKRINKSEISIKRDLLAYSFNEDFFSRLIIYKKVKSHTGRWAYVKVCKIIRFPMSISWTNDKLKAMAKDFNAFGIESKKTKADIISDFLD